MTLQRLIDFLNETVISNPQMRKSIVKDTFGQEIESLRFGREGILLAGDEREIPFANTSKIEYFTALFVLAEIQVQGHYQLANQYWPRSYYRLVLENPWWLIKTPYGFIKIGWRKRVINIDWSETKFRGMVTEDQVIKEQTYVHAYTGEKAVEYLKVLKAQLEILGEVK